MAAYTPVSADQDIMDTLEPKIEAMARIQPNTLVGIANKIANLLPNFNADGRTYYVLEWVYDTIVMHVDAERERRVMMMTENNDHTMDDDHMDNDHSDDMMDDDATDDTSDDNTDTPNDATDDTSDDAADTVEPTGAQVTVDVKGDFDLRFDMETIAVSLGDTVTINFNSIGGTHDWKIDEFDAATEIVTPTDGVTSVTFVADQAGSFEYYCSVGNHRTEGMVGTLMVE